MKTRRTTAVILAMLIYGSISIFVRGIDMSSGQIALGRGVIGSVFLLIAGLVTGQLPGWQALRKNLMILILAGAAIGFNWILLFEAYRYTTVPNATISYYFAPVFVMILAPFVLRESMTLRKALCLLIAVAGMFLIIGPDFGSGSGSLRGIVYGLAAAFLYACVVLMNQKLTQISGLGLTLVSLSVASVVLLPYVWLTDGLSLPIFGSQSMWYLVMIGIVHTGLAYVLYLGNIRYLQAQHAAMLSYIDQVFAILLSFLILGEHFGISQGIGAILVLGATLYSSWFSLAKADHDR